MERLLCILIGYIFGLFQTGYIIGKLHHIDIRDYGSGNSGTTNVMRTLGRKVGLITFFGDGLKCFFAVVVVKMIFISSYPNTITLLGMYAGVGAILGHNYPFYMKFKGGKGIAAMGGLILATNFWMAVIALAVFGLVAFTTKYVSVGSLAVTVVFLIEVITYGTMGKFGLAQPHLYELYGVVVFLMLLAFYKHKANIQRLLNGTENKIGSKKKKE